MCTQLNMLLGTLAVTVCLLLLTGSLHAILKVKREPPLPRLTWTELLRKDLFLNYDKQVRPTQHFNRTSITVDLVINHLELFESKRVLTVSGVAHMGWTDEKLRWNSSDYKRLLHFTVAPQELWTPDLVLYNTAGPRSSSEIFGGAPAIVLGHSGNVTWPAPFKFAVNCDVDLSKWPFDRQKCSLQLGSRSYTGEQVDILPPAYIWENEGKVFNAWRIAGASTEVKLSKLSWSAEPYSVLRCNLTLERVGYGPLAPAGAVLALTLWALWPGQNPSKPVLSAMAAVLASLATLALWLRFPAASKPPILTALYSNSLFLLCLSLTLTALFSSLRRVQPPYFLTTLLSTSHQLLRDEQGLLSFPSPPSNPWLPLKALIDKFLAAFYLLIFLLVFFMILY